jgi:hypothetical protein
MKAELGCEKLDRFDNRVATRSTLKLPHLRQLGAHASHVKQESREGK